MFMLNMVGPLEFYLRARAPGLARVAGFAAFWAKVFESVGLAPAMAMLDRERIVR